MTAITQRLDDVKFRLWLAALATLQFCSVFLNTFTNVRARGPPRCCGCATLHGAAPTLMSAGRPAKAPACCVLQPPPL